MRTVLLLGLLLTGVSCTPTHLVYVYDASVGIDVAYSTEGSGRLVFGYDRGTYAIVPQRDGREIMSLAAVSHVRSEGIDALQFEHFIATGKDAQWVAQDPAGLKAIRQGIFGDEK